MYRRSRGHTGFAALDIPFGSPTARRASFPTSSLDSRGPLSRCRPRTRDEPCRGHVQTFRTVPFADASVRQDKNAFAAIRPARPCPLSGRPIHRGPPLDYGPAPLVKPFRIHLTADTLPSGCLPAVRRPSSFLGCVWFQLHARLGARESLSARG